MLTPLTRARRQTGAYRQLRRTRGGGNTPFAVPTSSRTPDPGLEAEFVYWHPQRFGVELAPERILRQLLEIHPTLAACRPPEKAPVRHRWLIWAQDTHQRANGFCPGWYLVFVWEGPQTSCYLSLEPFALVGSNLYSVMKTKNGGAKVYFDRVHDSMAEGKASKEATYQSDRQDRQREVIQSHRITNIGQGNKFALHHDGTVVPSRGESNWSSEREKHQMPEAIRRKKADQQDQLRAAGWLP